MIGSDIFGSLSDQSMWSKLKFRLIKLDTYQFTIDLTIPEVSSLPKSLYIPVLPGGRLQSN